MIVTEATIRIALGLTTTITDLERAIIQVAHKDAEGKIKSHLKYDPEQRTHTEFFPRRLASTGDIEYRFDVNDAHSRAILEATTGVRKRELQLPNIPLRNIASLYVDENGRFGTGTSAFSSATEQTEGSDFWPEWDKTNFCPSGLLIANGTWPLTPGSVKVTYTGGYSPDELQGTADSDATSPYTTTGVDASPIRAAVINEALRRFKTFVVQQKNAIAGFLSGPLKSEKLQDYSYALGMASEMMTAMTIGLMPETQQMLEPFEHYGLIRI